MFRFIYLLRRSNNFRLMMLWLLIVVHGLMNHFFFATVATQFSSLSSERQRYTNYFLGGQFKTDYELAGPITQLRMDWAHTSHQIWWFLFVCGIIYLVALREEIARAWTVAHARMHAWIDLPDSPIPTVPGSNAETTTRRPRRERIWEQMYIFAREFLMALLAERLGERRISA